MVFLRLLNKTYQFLSCSCRVFNNYFKKTSGTFFLMALLVISLGLAAPAVGDTLRFPPPDFESGYEMPATETPQPAPEFYEYLNIGVLAAALGFGAYFIFKKRSRGYVLGLMLFSLAFFGFWRRGCICPVGATQNLVLTVFDGGYALPLTVLMIFLLPLVLSLFFGRIFCGSVCPLGAIQDVVLLKPVSVPYWLEVPLRLLGYFYLGLAVLLVVGGAGFIICRFDPFVSFFRLGGNLGPLALGVAFLVTGIFIGRPYCRFLCPYAIFLRHFSRISKWKVNISPDECIGCRLCEDSCPFGAIRKPTGEPSGEEVAWRKKILVVLIVLLPALVFIGGWGGALMGTLLSRTHPDVRLAERLYLEETGQVTGMTDETEAFRSTGDESVESLFARSTEIQSGFHRGSWLLGGFIGLVVVITLIRHTVHRSSDKYRADPGDCLACARCFKYCPREKLRRGDMEEEKNMKVNQHDF